MAGMQKKFWQGHVCVSAVCADDMRASLCAHTYSGCKRGGGGCLPVCDSEQRAGGPGMEQRICIDCFCASELFSHCQSCLHQLRGKLLHLHQEVFTFPFKKTPNYLFIFILRWEKKKHQLRQKMLLLKVNTKKF